MDPKPTWRRRAWLAWLACSVTLPAAASAAPAQRRPALMLASEAPALIDPAGWLVSEKLDGVRALWTGRVLQFRGGGLIAAPAWFTAALPADTALDGELWIGRGRFDAVSGAVRKAVPADGEWREVSFQLFDLPGAAGSFAERAATLAALARRAAVPWLQAVRQHTVHGQAALQQRLDQVVSAGGEGLMLHQSSAAWQAGRSPHLLKLKPVHDAEATVTGHVPGRGRHSGRLGALRVRADNGSEFLLGTGLTDAQRESPPPLGSVITFTHRGHTASGVPRFASFLRVRTGA
jgi:DNA ligase 1